MSTGRTKPGIKQNNENKESVDYGEQCVLFYTWAAFFVLSHHLLFVHSIPGFILLVVDYPKVADNAYTYFKKRRGERRLHDWNELWVHLVCRISLVALPMLMLASLVRTRLYSWCIHFRAWATQLVKFCIPNGTHSSFRSCNLCSPRPRFFEVGVYY